MASPTGSFRSSSRFFSFLGTTFNTRWERPPPSYDEAMKHHGGSSNGDQMSRRPLAPPPYSDTIGEDSNGTFNGGHSATPFPPSRGARGRRRSSDTIGTPPPEYRSREGGLHRLHLDLEHINRCSSNLEVVNNGRHSEHRFCVGYGRRLGRTRNSSRHTLLTRSSVLR